ncbi:DUF1715-domain-containing protein [Viridothelium virens]|uniref:DUF1715-domain-containing protein n=1 Tax=Viridothelium virens TaxID=1048519 RepID=A0A6A6H710_VIRVR|nr:DUF1715-domain-containing protein [Viridothelium virens]
MARDNFDSLLELEDEYYNEGFRLGVEDGSRAGRTEGRIFGLQMGFEKYVEMGQLSGNVAVWQARIPNQGTHLPVNGSRSDSNLQEPQEPLLPALQANSRLQRHLQTLYALVEPETLSTNNTEEAVSDVDDRLKRASAKAKMIEKIIGEGDSDQLSSNVTEPDSSSQEYDISSSVRARSQKSTSKAQDF